VWLRAVRRGHQSRICLRWSSRFSASSARCARSLDELKLVSTSWRCCHDRYEERSPLCPAGSFTDRWLGAHSKKIDRIRRLPLPEAELLITSIREKGARLAVPGVVDLSELAAETQGAAKIVLEPMQEMLLKPALQIAHDDYQDRRERQRQGVELAKAKGKYHGRKTDAATHQRIIALRIAGKSIAETARLAACSGSQVKRVWGMRGQAAAQ